MASVAGGQGKYVLKHIDQSDVVIAENGAPLPAPQSSDQVLVVLGGTQPPPDLPAGYRAIAYISGDGTLVDLHGDISFALPGGSPPPPQLPPLPTITVRGGGGAETISGGVNPIVVHAGSGNESLVGGSGPSTIFGGGGADTIVGGRGRSEIFAGRAPETIVGGTGPSKIYGGLGDSIVGGDGPTTVLGGAGDTIQGGAGPAVVYGATDESIAGGSGDFTVWAAGTDTVYGGSGPSVIYGGSGPAFLIGGTGPTTIQGAPGDTIVAANSPTVILAQAGFEQVQGGLARGSGPDTIVGGPGDTIYAGAGARLVNGALGNQFIVGQRGSDTIYGGPGDTITAGFNHNLGLQTNTVALGAGPELLMLEHKRTQATVSGFNHAAGDRLSFLGETKKHAIAHAVADQQRAGGNTILTLPDHMKLTLLGVHHVSSKFFT